MKIHDEIEDWMAGAECDSLSAEEHQQFEQHLAACPHCRSLYHEEKRMSTILEETLSTQRPDPQFEQRVVRGFREKAVRESILRRVARYFLWLSQRRPTQAVLTLFLLLVLVKSGALLTGEKAPGQIQRRTFGQSRTVIADGSNADAFGVNKDLASAMPQLEKQSVDEQPRNSDQLGLAIKDRLVGSAGGSGGSAQDGAMATFERNAERNFNDARTAVNAGTFRDVSGSGSIGGEINGMVTTSPVSATSAIAAPSQEQFGGLITNNGAVSISGGTLAAQAQAAAAPREEQQNRYRGAKDKAAKELDDKDLASAATLNFQTAAPANSIPSNAPVPDSSSVAPVDNRKLIRNASLELEVTNFQAAVDAITRLAGQEQGYLATQNSDRGANGKLQGTLVLKVRPANLDRFLLELRPLGELKNQAIGTQDVTKDYFDTDSRMRNSQIMEARLIEMLKNTKGKVSELLQVEKELARVRGEIEQMQGELKVYDSLIAYATVTVTLREKDLHEAAAYLLKENANLALYASDVEKTFAAVRREADEAKAQVLQSKLERDDNGRTTATLSLLLAPDVADGAILRIKALGRVQSYNVHDERVARDGSENSDTAKIERDKVVLDMVITPDDDARQQTNLTVITAQVEDAFARAKTEATALGAQIVQSSLNRDPQGRSTGQLTVRVPATAYEQVLAGFKKAGRVGTLAIQRNDRAGEQGSPVVIALTITSEESPVQQTNLRVLTAQVEEKAAAIKQAAAAAGAALKDSNFQRQNGGVELANLLFTLPMKNYPAFLEQIKALGTVKDFTVNRNDAAEGSPDTAPAQIALSLYSQGNLVADDSGLGATIRHTLSQGFAALLWSVRMIGVALAFLAPWALALGAVIGGVWFARRRKP
jgi:hypothetical protein